MGYALHCQETGMSCSNKDMDLICAWMNTLMKTLQENPAHPIEKAIKQCSKTHYDALDMDQMVKLFIGRPEAFYQFLYETWNWIVTVDPDGSRLLVDENKAECVCPLVRAGAVGSDNLCNCSEGLAEELFSTVLQRPIKARVVESILRGGTHCVYEIQL